MGFRTKFGFIFLEAIRSAPERWGITEIRIWDREVLQGVCQRTAEKEQRSTIFLIAAFIYLEEG